MERMPVKAGCQFGAARGSNTAQNSVVLLPWVCQCRAALILANLCTVCGKHPHTSVHPSEHWGFGNPLTSHPSAPLGVQEPSQLPTAWDPSSACPRAALCITTALLSSGFPSRHLLSTAAVQIKVCSALVRSPAADWSGDSLNPAPASSGQAEVGTALGAPALQCLEHIQGQQSWGCQTLQCAFGPGQELFPGGFLLPGLPGTIPKLQFACSHPAEQGSSEARFPMPAGLHGQECSQALWIHWWRCSLRGTDTNRAVGLVCSCGIWPWALEEEGLASLKMQWAHEEHGAVGREGAGNKGHFCQGSEVRQWCDRSPGHCCISV